MIREIEDKPKLGCGLRTVEGHGDYATCGKPWYTKDPYLCPSCLHKPLADAARTLIAALEEDSTLESVDARSLKVSKALGTLRNLYLEETQ